MLSYPRMAMARSRCRCAALLLAALFLPGAGPGHPQDGPTALRVGLPHHPLSLDPHRYAEPVTLGVLFNIYEPLVSTGSDLHLSPALAVSWESPDELTWRFHLRRGVRFHDGRLLTSRDVVQSLERARRMSEGEIAGLLSDVASVRALSEWEVELKTSKPRAVLVVRLSRVGILPWDAPVQVSQPVGTGPYRFVSHQAGQRVSLEAFTGYWGRPAPEARVDFLSIDPVDERIDRLLAGGIDLAVEVPVRHLPRIEAAACCRVTWRPGLVVEFLGMRRDRPPFTDRRVREAIGLALDRTRLVEIQLVGRGKPLGQMASPFLLGYDPEIPVPSQDLRRARRLLAEAGHPDGLELVLDVPERLDGGPIRDQLLEAGIRVQLAVRPPREFRARQAAGQMPFYFGGVEAWTEDASDLLDYLAHSPNTAEGRGRLNFTGLHNRQLDLLIESATATFDPQERQGLIRQALRALADEHVYLPLYSSSSFYGVRNRVDWNPPLNKLVLANGMRRRH